ncbi:TonB-dependent receptor [Thermomonas brevis]|uniref:TonB-dependent receptor n=1 Tax=Thermomonas brevis TaxID=215691 RepID=A0A7G9QWB6_9GAMM|nr:TonB-dependent receptor [Thermomonas brevis]QNN47641.1 TonB-dependent receptor [Thermomonas brevis]
MTINTRSNRQRRKALALAVALCFAAGAQAQTNTAGAVTGRAVAGDTLTISNPATGFSRTITVGGDGSYRFAQLPTGQYQLSRNGGAARSVTVNVGTATGVDFAGDATTLDAVTVVGSGVVNPIDVSSVESATIMTEAQIDRLPVGRDATSVALLAPGTVRGDNRFGNLASFGGASVAENVYYVNGFNVTNIVKGLAFSQIPFEALAEQQVKTGGYGAEFGRSLGGVINMITKRGTNEWKFGGNVYWSPDSLASGLRFAYDPQRDGSYTVEEGGKRDELRYNLYASGPLVKDRLFVFALYQGQKNDEGQIFEGGSGMIKEDSPQGLVKLDWQISDDHSLELTAFRDTLETDTVTYLRTAGDLGLGGGTENGRSYAKTGGENYVLRWNGYITDNLTLSALYGRGEYSRGATDTNSAKCPLVVDARSSAAVGPLGVQGCWIGTGQVADANAGDVRKAWRFDGEWALGDHLIRFGLDREEFSTVDGSVYTGTDYEPETPGGVYWRYSNVIAGQVLPGNGAVVPGGITEVVRLRYFENGGSFVTRNSAWYIEDNWSVTDNFLAYLGIRNESFTNLNSLGGAFIDVKNTWAPRLGFSWDVRGDSSLKVFGNAGRYYIPVYANTNVRLAGSELDYIEYYTFTGIDPATGAPTLGTKIGDRFYTGDGDVPDPKAVVDNELTPMYQDEYILGMQLALSEKWSLGLRGIHRNLKSGMDDVCDGTGAQKWAVANGYTPDEAEAIRDAIGHCFLTNPGNDLSINADLKGDGKLVRVDVPASAMGYPMAKRKYSALEVFVERSWDEKWSMQASYTWARSVGNTEGYVRSDNGQDDAGITTSFDFPGLMDGGYGYLPNDRRHSLKVFGAYKLAEEWTLGASLLVQSGRPYNCFGVYPDSGPNPTAGNYGAESFYCGYYDPETGGGDYASYLKPRGTAGRVGWAHELDLRLGYEPKWAPGLRLSVAVRNALDSKDYYRVQDARDDGTAGAPLSTYLHPRGFVAPRTVTFSVQYDF